MFSDTYTKIVLTVIAVLLALIAYNQVDSRVRNGVRTVLGNAGVNLLDLLATGLQKVQPLCVAVFAFRLFYLIRIYSNDHLLSDSWFTFRESDHSDILSFWILPLGLTAVGVAIFKKFFKKRIPASPIFLLICPMAMVALWYPVFDSSQHPAKDGPATTYVENSKVGCKDSKGNHFFTARYDDVDCFYFDMQFFGGAFAGNSGEDLIPVKQNGKWGFARRSGELAVPPRFDEYSTPRWGMRPVRIDSKWGFVYSESGEDAIPFEYDGAESFSYSGGMASPWAAVMKGGKWGFVDRLNQVRISFQFDDSESAFLGEVWHRNAYESSDRYRQRQARTRWQKIIHAFVGEPAPSPAWTYVRIGLFWGIIDSNGRLILPSSVPSDVTAGPECDTRIPRCYYEKQPVFDVSERREPSLVLTQETSWQCDGAPPNGESRPEVKLPMREERGHVKVSWAYNCKAQ
jgi:hypothetical protein